MKQLSPNLRSVLRVIIGCNTGKGRRGMLLSYMRELGITFRSLYALEDRGLVYRYRTFYGRGCRFIIKPTAAGRAAQPY